MSCLKQQIEGIDAHTKTWADYRLEYSTIADMGTVIWAISDCCEHIVRLYTHAGQALANVPA